MDRSKRTPKTPKRFDDEAFETPPKTQSQPKIQLPKLSVPVVHQIKLKPPSHSKLQPQPKATSSPQQQQPSTPPSQAKPSVQQQSKPKLSPEPSSQLKNIIKVKLPTKAKPHGPTHKAVPTKAAPSRAAPTTNTNVTAAPVPPPPPPVVVAVSPKETPKSYRPKPTKRPRTPPVYADLIPNVVLPFWDARTAAEDHEDDNVKELVHCHCGVVEECGLMVQCETCLTWQHAHCLGIERAEDAPDGYTCKACSDPKFARDSMKWAYDQDWLTKGRMKQFPCDPNPMPDKNIESLRQINQLISSVLNVHQMIHSLRVKTNILMNAGDDDPELKLFRVQWPATYVHRDGTQFAPTINNPSSTPASTISVMAETPDPGDINMADATLPDIGQLEDVSAILESPIINSTPCNDVTPNDCRANLRLHIQQTEEFIGIELSQIEEHIASLEKGRSFEVSLESLKNDLLTMKRYISLTS